MDMKLEVVIVPVSDVDRAKKFYERLGFREDIDTGGDDFRIVQFTPPGSAASIFVGKGLTKAEPGSSQLVLVVDDIEAAREELVGRGIDATEVFHDAKGLAFHTYGEIQDPGPQAEHESYRSYTAFSDPDGNGWVVQEIKKRLPGR
jgi:catechol 2,3-dioxygenase-like lactoylglutathione lyase family enzyme